MPFTLYPRKVKTFAILIYKLYIFEFTTAEILINYFIFYMFTNLLIDFNITSILLSMFRSDQNLPSPLFSITKDPEILKYNNGTEGEIKNILNNPIIPNTTKGAP